MCLSKRLEKAAGSIRQGSSRSEQTRREGRASELVPRDEDRKRASILSNVLSSFRANFKLYRIGETKIIRKKFEKSGKKRGKKWRAILRLLLLLLLLLLPFRSVYPLVGLVVRIGSDREKRKDRSLGRKEGRLTVYRATILEARRYRAWEGIELGIGNEANEGASCISMGRART